MLDIHVINVSHGIKYRVKLTSFGMNCVNREGDFLFYLMHYLEIRRILTALIKALIEHTLWMSFKFCTLEAILSAVDFLFNK